MILISINFILKYCKDGAIHPHIGLYYTSEILTKTENRFRHVTHKFKIKVFKIDSPIRPLLKKNKKFKGVKYSKMY